MIGKTIQGRRIISNTNNRVVLAHNPKAFEPWVVWWLDKDGDAYSGSYFQSRESAIKEFISRSFG